MARFFFNWWTLTILAAVIVALLLALGLPIFVDFLRPWWVRLICVVTVVVIWGIASLIYVLVARGRSDKIAKEIAEQPVDPGDEEAKVLAGRMSEAMAGLRKASGNKRDYLYSRPWYMIIGPPGAGKTTALLNSGLRFPFSDSALHGVGGTRNLDFWFADEAALVDTAGRYTTQDSDTATDSKAWEHFLGLLRRNRPLQPINGVLVAIGLDELIRGNRARIDAHASAVRRRLAELRKTLEVSAPIYVLFTKADLLSGFVEFYEDLNVDGRRAVLGATLPWGKPTSADALATEFDLFVQGIADRMSKRLQEEHDVRRRGLVLGFTPQVEGLRNKVLRFLEGAFLAEKGQPEPLRGFYFTSGVQEGAPLDRIMGGMAQVFEAPRQQEADGHGRAYFLNRLLTEVVFAEAGLVQTDAKARARRMGQLVAGFIGVGLVTLITMVLWGVSFANNQKLENDILAATTSAGQQLKDSGVDLHRVNNNDASLLQALPALNQLRNIPGGYADQAKGGPPIMSTWGLYQHDLTAQAKQTYLQALRRVLLPRVLLQLEDYLHANTGQPLNEFEPLRVYLTLGGRKPGGLNGDDAKAIKTWVENNWSTSLYPGPDSADSVKQLDQHLEAMLADTSSLNWPGGGDMPLDGALIAQAQQGLQTLSLPQRAYAILRQKAEVAGPPWITEQTIAPADSAAFANSDAVMKLSVPYFYTMDGYQKVYLAGLPTVAADMNKELWVYGSQATNATSMQAELDAVRNGVANLYSQDYISAWSTVVTTPQPANYFSNPTAMQILTKIPSPYTLILTKVVQQTTFKGGAMGFAQQQLQQKLGSNSQLALSAAQQGSTDAGAQIMAAFQPLALFVGDGTANSQIGKLLASVAATQNAQANTQMSAIIPGAAGGGGGTPSTGGLAPALVALTSQTNNANVPPMLKPFMNQVGSQATSTTVKTAAGAVASAYTTSVATPCQTLVANHYPFVAAAPADAPIQDMQSIMGLSGTVDGFVKTNLVSLLDTSGPVWRWKPEGTDNTSPYDPLSAEQFHRASELRDMLASGEPIQITVSTFGGTVTAAELGAGANVLRFDTTNATAPQTWTWQLNQNPPEAHVALYAGAAKVATFPFQGPYALFRLMDSAQKQNLSPTSFNATFGQGAQSVTLKITLPTENNPFSRGGPWSFRCPSTL